MQRDLLPLSEMIHAADRAGQLADGVTKAPPQVQPAFKAEAVQMVIETGKPIAEVARDLGIHDGALGNWVTPGGMSTLNLTSPCLRWSVRA
jgi:Transposase